MNRKFIEKELYEIFDDANLIELAQDNSIVLNNNEIDSIQLISIIVEIEERFNIEIPDEYLVSDFLSDFKHVADVVEDIINTKKDEVYDKTD